MLFPRSRCIASALFSRLVLLILLLGSFARQSCIECKEPYPQNLMNEAVEKKEPPHCLTCMGLVKPEIVFFGEALPSAFFEAHDIPFKADLAIVMGESSSLHTIMSLISRISSGSALPPHNVSSFSFLTSSRHFIASGAIRFAAEHDTRRRASRTHQQRASRQFRQPTGRCRASRRLRRSSPEAGSKLRLAQRAGKSLEICRRQGGAARDEVKKR